MIRRSLLAIGIVALALARPHAGAPDQWPQFRGPSAGVAADDAALPDRWSATENVVWKLDVPGVGWSSPVVWGDHVFVTAVINSGPAEAAEARAVHGRRAPRLHSAASMDGARRRFHDRQGALVEGRAHRRRPEGRSISRTATRRRRRSPTASACMSTSATSASSSSTWKAHPSGRSRSGRSRPGTDGAPPRRPFSTAIGSTSSTTTTTSRSWRRTTSGRAPRRGA